MQTTRKTRFQITSGGYVCTLARDAAAEQTGSIDTDTAGWHQTDLSFRTLLALVERVNVQHR